MIGAEFCLQIKNEFGNQLQFEQPAYDGLPMSNLAQAVPFPKGYDDVRVVTGVLCGRKRIAKPLGTTAKNPGHRLRGAVKNPMPPFGTPG
jgi:hypothetical protein